MPNSEEDVQAQAEKCMAHIEMSFLTMQAEHEKLYTNQVILQDQITNDSKKLDLRIHELQYDLGTKPLPPFSG